jgi:uncharacterized NAD(P)/FAD-binding protein YdhS
MSVNTVNRRRVAIIGCGPRGAAILERLCTGVRRLANVDLTVYLVDPFEPGPGRVWTCDQSDVLLMNSTASDVTAFPDEALECLGASSGGGPTHHAWSRDPGTYGRDEMPAGLRFEAQTNEPWSYPSRALHGHYLRWAFERTVAEAPPNVHLQEFRTKAVAVRPVGTGRYAVELEAGECLETDSVVLAVGHYDNLPSAQSKALAAAADQCGLKYFRSMLAAEAGLSNIASDETVILTGLGLTFFDYVARLTSERGGCFRRKRGALVYQPSGREPRLLAASRLGVPFRAGVAGRCASAPRHQLRYVDRAFARRLRREQKPSGIDFRADLWPRLRKELAWAFYLAQAVTDDERAALASLFDASGFDDSTIGAQVAERWSRPIEILDWTKLLEPAHHHVFTSRAEFNAWIRGFLGDDIARSRTGAADPMKALAVAVREARSVIREIVSFGGIDGASYERDVLRWYNGINNVLGSGPPAARVEEVLALAQAGVVEFVGPGSGASFDARRGAFVTESAAVVGSRRHATALVECYLPSPDVRRSADPLLTSLLRTGVCRPYRMTSSAGGSGETGAIDVEPHSFRVVAVDGAASADIYCFGPPLEGLEWLTASSARPGPGAPLMVQANRIASDILCAPECTGDDVELCDGQSVGAR